MHGGARSAQREEASPVIDPYKGTGAISRPEFPDYAVAPECATPGCDRRADDRHEVWSRANAGGLTSWVEVDGLWIGNRIGLCRPHHEQVTGELGGHKAAIVYDDQAKQLVWLDLEARTAGLLEPHPPVALPPATTETDTAPETVARAREAAEEAQRRAEEPMPVAPAIDPAEPHTQREDGVPFFAIDPPIIETAPLPGEVEALLGGEEEPPQDRLELVQPVSLEEIRDAYATHPAFKEAADEAMGVTRHEPYVPPAVLEQAEKPREVADDDICPTCHRRKPAKRKKTDLDPEHPHKGKRTWSVAVPNEEREDGYALIEENLKNVAAALGLYDLETDEGAASWKYRALVDGLGWLALHYDAQGEE